MYAYVRNNPTTLTDPSGLDQNDSITQQLLVAGTTALGGMIGAAIGGAIGGGGGTLVAPGFGTISGAAAGGAEGFAIGAGVGLAAGQGIVHFIKGTNEPSGSQGSTQQGTGSEPKLKYEDSPKHGPEARGDVSPSPTDGAGTLQDSVQIKDTSSARIGVDKSNDEIVVFRETSPNTYHGYVAKWSDLNPQQRSALIKAGKATPKGKMLP